MTIQTDRHVDVISRKDLLREMDYGPGQHLTMIGPTQRGKTTLCIYILNGVATPDHKALILAGKPPHRDPVMNEAAKHLNMRVVEEWPPVPSIKDRKRNGYVLRPRQTMKNLDADDANVREQFRKGIMSNYRSTKPVITVVDEAHHVQYDMKLKRECEAPLMRGAPHNAEWSLIQRGRFVSYHCYGAPEHLFIFYDPDRDNRKRYSDIGGVDPEYLERITEGLRLEKGKNGNTISECVYIRRSGPQIMIVDTS